MIKGHQSFSHKTSGKLFLVLELEKTILCNSNMGLEWVDGSGLPPKNGDCPPIQRVSTSYPFAVCGDFFDYLIYVKICKNHTSDKVFSSSYCKQNFLNRKKRETEIEVLKQMKKKFFCEDGELPGQH